MNDAPAVTSAAITARIERLPFSRWHFRTMAIMGTAGFFDAFDSLTIAMVLPVLVTLWQLSHAEVGYLISIGYIGQLIGAISLSWAAERVGRVRALQWTIGIIAVMSLACAFAGSYAALLGFRAIQGLGLGGEVPIAATYINEVTRAAIRGRVVFAFQTIFAFGITATSVVAVWLVPHLGWQSMFLVGGIPAILAVWLSRLVPESPRWLAGRGRLAEADRVVTEMEAVCSHNGSRALPAPLPEVPEIVTDRASFRSLFSQGYVTRTLSAWAIMFCTSFVSNGLLTWLPTLYTTVYHLPVGEALTYTLSRTISSFVGAFFCIALIDKIGRRPLFMISFIGTALPLLVLALSGPVGSPVLVMILSGVASLFSTAMPIGVYVYVPEIYPTRMRALGAGVASSWLRIATIVAPSVVGLLLGYTSVSAVFWMFGATSLFGALVVYVFVIETRGRTLESISR